MNKPFTINNRFIRIEKGKQYLYITLGNWWIDFELTWRTRRDLL